MTKVKYQALRRDLQDYSIKIIESTNLKRLELYCALGNDTDPNGLYVVVPRACSRVIAATDNELALKVLV